MLALALACGGLAASEVGGRVREVERQVGAPVPVVVAARDLPADTKLKRADLHLRQVPERYAAPDSLSDPGQATGVRIAVPIASGTQLSESQLGGASDTPARGGRARGTLRRGERAVEVAVTGGAALADAAGPGARVDVLVSTESRDGPGRSFLALEDVELLALRAGAEGGAPAPAREDQPDGAPATALATLRVTLRQAVYLTAAQNFAREVRLLSRPAGDGRRSGRTAVDAGSL